MTTTKFENVLQQKLRELDSEKQPERDLWKGIELGIESERKADRAHHSYGYKIWASAATLGFVALLSWFAFTNIPAEKGGQLNGEELVQALSQQHEQQKQALLVTYEGQQAVTQNWQQQMRELDEAADAIKAALQQDPDNTALLKMLQNVYQQQITLIERVHAPKWQQI